ncbi:MAG: hypothetical protein B7Y40_06750 [Gammaproteobacteria bacterium 28-57-27]|nr:MAG: hypothetical protein B7Y40_06750 [Gammaproteobacteria bacterium 28-57-27]
MRLLLVEDDPLIAEAVAGFLRQRGHAVDCATGERKARAFLASADHDLLLLDWRLAEGSGISLLEWLRRQPPPLQGLPVLMLTAMDEVSMRIQGLEAGADDYLVKPFDLHELHARIQALGRRRTENCITHLSCGELELEPSNRILRLRGTSIELSGKECALLEMLMQQCGKTVSRERLHALLYDWERDVASNTLEVFISNLRKKLGSQSIQTLRGLGYRLRPGGGS